MSKQLSFDELMAHHGFNGRTKVRGVEVVTVTRPAPAVQAPDPTAVFEAASERALAFRREAEDAMQRWIASGHRTPPEPEVWRLVQRAGDTLVDAGKAGLARGANRASEGQYLLGAASSLVAEFKAAKHAAEAPPGPGEGWAAPPRPKRGKAAPRPPKGTPTGTNLFVLGELAARIDLGETHLRVAPGTIPHARRCIAAGLLHIAPDGTVTVTPEGRRVLATDPSARQGYGVPR